MITQGPRTAPATWLARFRAVEPTAEMLDMGDGRWDVGSFSPNDQFRKIKLKARAAHIDRRGDSASTATLRRLEAQAEGFRHIAFYTDADLWSGEAFRDFAIRDWNWRHRADEAFEENLTQGKDDAARDEERRKEHQLMARELAPYLIAKRSGYVRVGADLKQETGT